MLSLLSSTTRLEVLLLDRVGLPPGGHNWGSADEQKPVTMPHLRKLGLLRTDSIFIQKLVSCIQAGNCTLIALQYTTLSSINFLRSRVASIASSAEKIFLHIDDHEDQGLISISTFDHLNKIRPFSVSEATSDVTGFSVVFLTGPNSVNLEQAMPFIAYTPIPISMTLHSSPKASQAALARLDWDRLPSLCELRTEPYINIPPILYRLSGPRGPRHAPRWPCPKLTILRLLRLKFLPPAFVWHLHLRWGPPESDDGLKRDPSRPAQLTLCQAPLQGISKLLSPDAMKHFAEEWEDSVPVEEVGETLKDHSRRSSDDLDDLEEASETSET
ncbi:hypothetical protein FRB90_004203 [Tulasnella sp. 427]|nr:hypothetical protein FRB90_004203 [Tulasnella sp. 427]